MCFKVIDEIIKVTFKKTDGETKVGSSSIFYRFGRVNGIEQEIQQRNDEHKLKNAKKYTRQREDEKRYNEFRIRSRKSKQATIYFHFLYL